MDVWAKAIAAGPPPSGLMSDEERLALQQCEADISLGMEQFEIVGRALWRIKDNCLYRATHASFEAYCEERWELPATTAKRYVACSKTGHRLAGLLPSLTKQSHLQGLKDLPRTEVVKVIATAKEIRKRRNDNGEPSARKQRITAEDVADARAKLNGQPVTPIPPPAKVPPFPMPPEHVNAALVDGRFRSALAKMANLKRDLNELSQSPAGRHLREIWHRVEADLMNVDAAIKGTQPWAPCTMCRGRGGPCQPCHGSGHMTRTQYDNAPPELRTFDRERWKLEVGKSDEA